MPLREVYERTTIRTVTHDADEPAHLLMCTATDPFGIDDPCTNATGHYPIASCGTVVCVHCAKVFWQ
jgi:hypothetical protein